MTEKCGGCAERRAIISEAHAALRIGDAGTASAKMRELMQSGKDEFFARLRYARSDKFKKSAYDE